MFHSFESTFYSPEGKRIKDSSQGELSLVTDVILSEAAKEDKILEKSLDAPERATTNLSCGDISTANNMHF